MVIIDTTVWIDYLRGVLNAHGMAGSGIEPSADGIDRFDRLRDLTGHSQ